MYETQKDRDNELVAINKVAEHFQCIAEKTPLFSFCDFKLFWRGSLAGYSEVKTRSYTMEKIYRLGGYKLSKDKWDTAKSVCIEVPFILVLNMQDAIWLHVTRDFAIDGIDDCWGRPGRPKESAIILKTHRFRRLDELPRVRVQDKGTAKTEEEKVLRQAQEMPEQPHHNDGPDVRRIDRTGPTYTEEFRNQCEARYVLKLRLPDRRAYLDGVEKKRGKYGRRYLEDEIMRQWKQKKAPQKGG